jgi:hypothetical protein
LAPAPEHGGIDFAHALFLFSVFGFPHAGEVRKLRWKSPRQNGFRNSIVQMKFFADRLNNLFSSASNVQRGKISETDRGRRLQ